jgi:hypothetical protein
MRHSWQDSLWLGWGGGVRYREVATGGSNVPRVEGRPRSRKILCGEERHRRARRERSNLSGRWIGGKIRRSRGPPGHGSGDIDDPYDGKRPSCSHAEGPSVIGVRGMFPFSAYGCTSDLLCTE